MMSLFIKFTRVLILFIALQFTTSVQAQTVFSLPQKNVVPGEKFCTEMSVVKFDSVLSFLVSFTWDSTVLKLDSYKYLLNPSGTGTLAGFSPKSNQLNVSWLAEDASCGLILPDGTKMVELCFTVIGMVNDSTDIKIDGVNGNPIDAVRSTKGCVDFEEFLPTVENGKVKVLDLPKPLQLIGEVKSVPQNTGVCIAYTTKDFTKITTTQYSINFDPSVLTFTGIQQLLPAYGTAVFNTTNVATGVISVSWSSANPLIGLTIPDDFVLFAICFDATGVPGSMSDVSITGLPTPILVKNSVIPNANIGIAATNGKVTILSGIGKPLELSLNGPIGLKSGDVFCFDVSAREFKNMVKTDYSINWNSARFVLDSLVVLNTVSGLVDSNFTINQANGNVQVKWTSPASPVGITIANDAVMYRLCFTTLANGCSKDSFYFSSNPLPFNIVTTTSNGNDIGVKPKNLSVSVSSSTPTGIELNMNPYSVQEQSVVCVDVFAKEFKEVQSIQFSLKWDSTVVVLDSIKSILPGFSNSSFNINNTKGIANLTWNGASAVTYKSNVALLTLCFKAIGLSGQMTPVSIVGSPTNIEIGKLIQDPACNDDSTYIVPLQTIDGKISIENVVFLADTNIIKTTCCNIFRSGKIDIFPTGGLAPYQYNWSGPFNFKSTSQNISNLGEGLYTLSITDSLNNRFFGKFLVEGDYSTPTVFLQDSAVLNCIDTMLRIDAQGDSTGVSFVWLTNDGNIVGGSSSRSIMLNQPGTYVVIASRTGVCCAVTDTIVVTANKSIPFVSIAQPQNINCNIPSKSIDANINSTANLSYEWTTNLGNILSGSTTKVVNIDKGGMYYFKVVNQDNGCSKVDSVFVNEDKIKPSATINATSKLSCVMPTTVLVGNGPTGGNITYDWTSTDGNFVNGNTTLTPLVNKGGTYRLIISNSNNGCKDTASINVAADFNKPKADAGQSNQLLDCKKTNITLGGGTTSTGVNYFYQWFKDGVFVTSGYNKSTYLANIKGNYLFEVVDTSSGCRDTSVVLVIKDTLLPTALIKTPIAKLTCDVPTALLDGSGSSKGARFVYQWSTVGGSFAGNTSGNIVTVNDQGKYKLVVKDTVNSCLDSVLVDVIKNATIPTANIVVASSKITCATPVLTMNSTGSSSGSKITYAWKTTDGNLTGANNLNAATLDKAGSYFLIVTDTSNNCKDTSSVVLITGNTTKPTVSLTSGTITCIDSIITIITTGTSIGTKMTYLWSTADGKIVSGGSSLSAKVNQGGTYTLVVKDTSNNCIDSTSVFMNQDKVPPIASAGPDKLLTCVDSLATLDGNASSSGSKFNYSWTTIGGNLLTDPALPTMLVNRPGRYILSLLDTKNGCRSRDTAVVVKNVVEPNISNFVPAVIKCPNTTSLIDASNSTNGDSITYQWSTGNGVILNGEFSNKLLVGSGGDYLLVVTNIKNQCKSVKSINVGQAVFPLSAVAGVDLVICDDAVTLMANEPNGTQGKWSFLDGTEITTLASFEKTDLKLGNNFFVWTLSTVDCPNYSSDTITVNRSKKPVAVNDLVNKPFAIDTLSINVAKNDNVGANWSITVLSQPRIGTLTKTEEGKYAYTAPKSFFGNVTFTYILCNNDCPDLCDTAEVRITVQADPDGIDGYLPNAITPNEDGLNDRLVFDIIDPDGKEYPQNDIVIYNRWGDVVFEASPYKNDWNGVGKDGSILPQATYYYILRLNIPGGTILRGDVTILKK